MACTYLDIDFLSEHGIFQVSWKLSAWRLHSADPRYRRDPNEGFRTQDHLWHLDYPRHPAHSAADV